VGAGWLNAHCHLELSHLKGRIRPGLPFAQWLSELVALRRSLPPEEAAAAATDALLTMQADGTSALLDILTLDLAEPALRTAPAGFRTLAFRELLGLNPPEAPMRLHARIGRESDHPGFREGLSPHAPYSVSPMLFRLAARSALLTHQWLCIHAAEVPEETQFVLYGRGPLRDFLEPFIPPGWQPPAMRPIPYLDSLGCLGPTTLLVHCNDITDAEIGLIARAGCSVVVCPGTHVYFARREFPLERLLAAGVPTFLGTDSLASNEALSMEREVGLAFDLCGKRIPREKLEQLASAERAAPFFPPTMSPSGEGQMGVPPSF
jgi:cytosine/adenosine deaminase-related metal-dependent hydrolase